MSKQAKPPVGGSPAGAQAGTAAAPKRKAWWRRIERKARPYPYVISEGGVFLGRKTPHQRAWVWIEVADEAALAAANDPLAGMRKED